MLVHSFGITSVECNPDRAISRAADYISALGHTQRNRQKILGKLVIIFWKDLIDGGIRLFDVANLILEVK